MGGNRDEEAKTEASGGALFEKARQNLWHMPVRGHVQYPCMGTWFYKVSLIA